LYNTCFMDDDLLPRAFAVVGELPPEAGPPTTGEDYLRRVRWESRRCPDVVVSAIDPRQYDNKQTQFAVLPPPCPPPPPGMAPLTVWERGFLAQFSELRQAMNRTLASPTKPSLPLSLPHQNDVRGWYLLCFGTKEKEKEESDDVIMDTGDDVSSDTGKSPSKGRALPPLMSIVAHLDQVTVMALLQHHITWFETRSMTPHRAMWLYALLVRLEKPLDPDIAASLRSLLRRLSHFRSKLVDLKDPLLPTFNILITIVAKYFNQQDPD